MEDIRSFPFAPLTTEKIKPSNEQLEAMDDLITSLLVDDDDEENEDVIKPGETLNPYYQHLYTCLTHRALHPGRVLPEPDSYNQAIMAQPKSFSISASGALSKIAKVFPLEKVQTTKTKMSGNTMFGKREADSDANENTDAKRTKTEDVSLSQDIPAVDAIGTVTPVEDFKTLLQGGIQFGAIVVQMQKVIIQLLSDAIGEQFDQKILECIKIFRETSLQKKISNHFNDFISEWKQTLMSQNKMKLWQKMVEQDLSLISVLEEPGSSYTSEEVNDFNKVDDKQEEKVNDDDNDEDLVSITVIYL